MLVVLLISFSLFIYVVSGMLSDIKKSIVTNPYPYTYEKPVKVISGTKYEGGGAVEYSKYLDSLADAVDSSDCIK